MCSCMWGHPCGIPMRGVSGCMYWVTPCGCNHVGASAGRGVSHGPCEGCVAACGAPMWVTRSACMVWLYLGTPSGALT